MKTETPFNHGHGGYTNHGCRCEVCRAAATAWMTRWRTRKGPEDATAHGSYSTYTNYGCRCDACSAAARLARRKVNLYLPVDLAERLECVAAALDVPARQLALDLLRDALYVKENR